MLKLTSLFSCLLIIISLLLNGCIVGAAAGGAIGGASAADSRDFSQRTTDQSLQQQIGNLIYKDPTLHDNAQVAISVYDNNVLLAGRVTIPSLRERAEKMAYSVKGVNRVYNQLTVGEPISAFAQTHDAWITTKVKSALLTASGINSNLIKVVTDDDIVYLFGKLNQRQADLVADTASQVSDVKQVVTLFRDPSTDAPIVTHPIDRDQRNTQPT